MKNTTGWQRWWWCQFPFTIRACDWTTASLFDNETIIIFSNYQNYWHYNMPSFNLSPHFTAFLLQRRLKQLQNCVYEMELVWATSAALQICCKIERAWTQLNHRSYNIQSFLNNFPYEWGSIFIYFMVSWWSKGKTWLFYYARHYFSKYTLAVQNLPLSLNEF